MDSRANCFAPRFVVIRVRMSPALGASIGGTILVPPFNEQSEGLGALRTYRHLRRAVHCLRCGLMSDAGPSECPPTVRGRRLLGCKSLRRFSFACSLKILVLEMDLRDRAIGFSSSPPSDRSCGSEDCSRDGNAVATIETLFVKNELGNPPPNH